MNLKLEAEYSKAGIFKEIDELKKQIDAMRPLPEDVEGRVMQKLRLDWNYHSNAIEGNRLTYGETVAFLMEGITAKGKPLKDHLDIRGHNEAINFLLDIVKDERTITETDIRNLHQVTLVEPYDVPAQTASGQLTKKRIKLGEYKTLPNHVETSTGEKHYYALPEETPAKMQELMEWYAEVNQDKSIHPVVIAALFHHKFVAIHPFDDGNGRLSRILMNLSLMQRGYPPLVIKIDDRKNYYALLNRADKGDGWPFVEYIAENLISSLSIYLKAANGGDIDEDEDIDKEIALLKIELKNGTYLKVKKSTEVVDNIVKNEIISLFNALLEKIKTFDEFFFSKDFLVSFRDYTLKRSFNRKYFSNSGFSKYDVEHYLSSNHENYSHLLLVNEHKEFKNSITNFNIVVSILVTFNEYTYDIEDKYHNLIVSKLYHEKIDKKDLQIIVKAFINSFKKELQETLKKN
jgi:Fic family protein